jgi:MerR family transcriptional regulator, light-induced transcriptional regulator
MPNLDRETGQTIESQRQALAETVVNRQYRLQPGLRDRYGEGGQAKCVQDTEYHLAYLAAAVTYSSPALFCDYIAWAKALLAAFNVGPEDVGLNLVCLRDVLGEKLPGGMGEAVAPYVEAALRTLPEAPTVLPSFVEGEDALSGLARQYLQILLRAKRNEASRLILDAVRTGVGVADIYQTNDKGMGEARDGRDKPRGPIRCGLPEAHRTTSRSDRAAAPEDDAAIGP